MYLFQWFILHTEGERAQEEDINNASKNAC